MSTSGDQIDRHTRLYTFPGGVFEIEESPEDQPGVGVYIEHRSERSCNDAREFGPGEGPEVA